MDEAFFGGDCPKPPKSIMNVEDNSRFTTKVKEKWGMEMILWDE